MKYICREGEKFEMKISSETDRKKFEPCGSKIDNRLTKPAKTSSNPNQKSDCERQIAEPKLPGQDFFKTV
jgi:hypothetical protein